MTRIYSSPDFIEITRLKDLLVAQGILCFLQNELPFGFQAEGCVVGAPELWVENDAEALAARAALKSLTTSTPPDGPNWTCPKCSETLAVQFTSCWQCGAPKPSSAA